MRSAAAIVILGSMLGCVLSQDFPASDPAANLPEPADAGCGSPSDPENCGACGHSCLGGACVAAKCAPVVLASGQGDSSWPGFTSDIGDRLEGPDRIAADETHVYWLNLRGEVMRVPVTGGPAERIATAPDAPAWIVLDGDFVYFSTLRADIFRVPRSGGAAVRLVSGSTNGIPAISLFSGPYPLEFLLSGNRIYWAGRKGIVACPLAGCSVSPVAISPGDESQRPFSFAIDAAGTRYASVENHHKTSASSEQVNYALTVFREDNWLGMSSSTAYYELHGGGSEVYAFATTDFGPTGVVRWTESSVTFLASGDSVPPRPHGLTLDDDFVYWANAAAPRIDRKERTASVVRCSKKGCASPEVLADGQITPRAVATSKGAVYWTTGDGNVMKIAKPVPAEPRAPW